jgi:hypothetical protein
MMGFWREPIGDCSNCPAGVVPVPRKCVAHPDKTTVKHRRKKEKYFFLEFNLNFPLILKNLLLYKKF